MTTPVAHTEERPLRRARLALAGAGSAGGVTLAFLLLVLCGVSGAAVLDPALGAWNSVISSRADGARASRAVVLEGRFVGATSALRLARGVSAGAPAVRTDGWDALSAAGFVRTATVAGLLDLPPPTLG